MAIELEGNNIAQKGNRAVTSDYGQRAALAVNRLVPGPHRDKTVARIFGCSVRFAKYLRAGQHWTAERFTQASAAIHGFDAAIADPQLSARLDQLECELADLRAFLRGEDDGQ